MKTLDRSRTSPDAFETREPGVVGPETPRDDSASAGALGLTAPPALAEDSLTFAGSELALSEDELEFLASTGC